MKIGQKKQLIAEVQNKTFYNINESYSPSIASFSYFVTFDVLKTPLMLRADKIDKQNEWCSKRLYTVNQQEANNARLGKGIF